MRKTIGWLVMGAIIVLALMSGMFWLFYTLPITIFVFGLFYYIGKSSIQRIRMKYQQRRKASP